ncbi:MAG: HlyD family type I secretion periplasmic adaptor subunit [Acetobacteraceae bacterium]|nr:HlyD family type I secretion periplasmic adaptor subunit [Acetobacteraceae bacterium]
MLRDPAMPIVLAFQSPSSVILAAPIPWSARGTTWVIAGLFAASLAAMWLIPVDRVVTAQGKVVSQAPNLVVQPLETAIVRSIDVKEGQIVHAGDVLARLDPTFAAADVGSLAAQVASLEAEVSRLQAEAEDKPFIYTGLDPNLMLQAAIYAQRAAEKNYKLENYKQKIDGLAATLARSVADIESYRQRRAVAERVEEMRLELEKLQVGSKLNSLAATDNRLEIERGLANAMNTAESARRDISAMSAERASYFQNWKAEVSQHLAEQTRKLADLKEQLAKAQRRRQLVELRADTDATVLSVSKVSVGSVLQSGEAFLTLVPLNAPLEVETNVAGRDDGFVHAGDPVAIKFDTFPFSQYGLAYGVVRTISPDSFTPADEQRTRSGKVPLNPTSVDPYYRARISIDEVKLHDTPPGFHIAPGMPVTADIKVGKRTVLNYLLGRVLPTVAEAMREP